MQPFVGPEAANDTVTPVPGREPLQLTHLAAGEAPKEETQQIPDPSLAGNHLPSL